MPYTYATLSTAINNWASRPYAQPQLDEFIMLAEASFARKLRGYQREITTTIALTAGVGPLPVDFIRAKSVSYSTFGTLKQVDPDSLVALNPAGESDIPTEYTITGGNIAVGPLVTDNLTMTYMASLAPLSETQDSNWLLALAPDAYLYMCKAQQRAFEEEWDAATGFETKANSIIDELNLLSDTAQYGRASLVINGPTP